jgi:hypothetical protein
MIAIRTVIPSRSGVYRFAIPDSPIQKIFNRPRINKPPPNSADSPLLHALSTWRNTNRLTRPHAGTYGLIGISRARSRVFATSQASCRRRRWSISGPNAFSMRSAAHFQNLRRFRHFEAPQVRPRIRSKTSACFSPAPRYKNRQFDTRGLFPAVVRLEDVPDPDFLGAWTHFGGQDTLRPATDRR